VKPIYGQAGLFKNNVIANLGIITAGVLVSLLASPLPDLVIGLIISVVVIKGGVSIIQDVKNEPEH